MADSLRKFEKKCNFRSLSVILLRIDIEIDNFIYICQRQVIFSDGSTITYSYAADGTKLRTVHVISGTTTTKNYYANVVYENDVLKLC